MTLNEFINWSIIELKQSREEKSTFYDYAKCKLNEWQCKIKEVNISELLVCIQKETIKPIKEKSFYNFLNHITNIYLEILKYTYQGNLFEAIVLLRNLLYKQKYTQNKLTDEYINYFSVNIIDDKEYFRVVDFKAEECPTNCNHVPFDKRNGAKHSRFNSFGYPCLYLSNNLGNCIEEVGELKKSHKRYYSKFVHKKSSTIYFNLTIPVDASCMSDYDKFCFIITYPMFLLCISPTTEDAKFEEEYFFPQLLFPALFLTENNEHLNHFGIAYNSTKDYMVVNLAIPAKLDSDEVIPQNIICDFISENITEIGPFELI